MTTILTWNLNKKKTKLLKDALSEIIANHTQPDILVFQEAYGTWVNTILNGPFEEINYPKNSIGSGVRIFLKTKKYKQYSVQRTDNKKLVFIHLQDNTTKEEFNIAAVHLYSKVGNSERQQLWKNLPIIQKINEFESTSTNNDKTILIGDFNHNPFENDLNDPNMINGVESKKLISTITLNPLSKRNLNFWYNPMWNLMGDFDFRNNRDRVTGTYFRYTEDENQIWNFFDGVLLRPSMMDRVNYNFTEVLTSSGTINFLKPFIIRKDESLIKDDLSDHLPVKLTLN
jgi:exonuclease III